MTPRELKLWVWLRLLRTQGFHFRRQVPIDAFVMDFACLKQRLVIEIDGGQHARSTDAAADRIRGDRLRQLGFSVTRFWNVDVDRNLAGVIEAIVARLSEEPLPTPAATRRTLPCGEG